MSDIQLPVTVIDLTSSELMLIVVVIYVYLLFCFSYILVGYYLVSE